MILAVMGNVLISAGLIATKGAHMQLDKIKSRLPEGQAPPSYVKLPGWWLGFLCTVGGELGNFMAYGTSTLSAQGATTPPNAIAPQTHVSSLYPVGRHGFRVRQVAQSRSRGRRSTAPSGSK